MSWCPSAYTLASRIVRVKQAPLWPMPPKEAVHRIDVFREFVMRLQKRTTGYTLPSTHLTHANSLHTATAVPHIPRQSQTAQAGVAPSHYLFFLLTWPLFVSFSLGRGLTACASGSVRGCRSRTRERVYSLTRHGARRHALTYPGCAFSICPARRNTSHYSEHREGYKYRVYYLYRTYFTL